MNTKTKSTLAILLSTFALSACSTMGGSSGTGQVKFRTPEQAVAAFEEIAGQGNDARLKELFGPDSLDLLRSGDDVADRDDVLEIKALINEKVAFEDLDEKTKVPLFGNDAWPFPIPLAKERGGWRFDTETGREEIANRRIGLNEIRTLATLHGVVDAQREYYSGRHEGRSGAYARRVISTEGKQDGLYWPTEEGEPGSPLGPLVADATVEGYKLEGRNPPEPYHGYLYKMLTAQGPSVSGGAKSYIDSKGAMTKGFAMVAWPAKYGNSGKMTFLVDFKGIVFQKDLGESTAEIAAKIDAYDPEASWAPTGD